MATQTISIQRQGTAVFLALNGQPVMAMPWQLADELCRALKVSVRAARLWAVDGSLPPDPEITLSSAGNSIAVRQHADTVLLLANGRLVVGMPASVAERLWSGVFVQARRCEEQEKADQIAMDAAILFRSGAPFGITGNRKIQDEMIKHAVHDRDLRRFMPGGVKSTVILGAPVISNETRSVAEQVRSLVPRLSTTDRRALATAVSN